MLNIADPAQKLETDNLFKVQYIGEGETHESMADLTYLELRVFLAAGIRAVERYRKGGEGDDARSPGRPSIAFRVWTECHRDGVVVSGLQGVTDVLDISTSCAIRARRVAVAPHVDAGEMYVIPDGLMVARTRKGVFCEEALYQRALENSVRD